MNFLRTSIQNIIVNYPGSLYVDSLVSAGGNATLVDFVYNESSNISTFKVPAEYIDNKFGILFNYGNLEIPFENEIKNLNLSFEKYVIWSEDTPDNV